MQANLSKSSTSLTSQGRHRHHHCQSHHHHHNNHPHHSQPHLRQHPLQSEHHHHHHEQLYQQEQHNYHHHMQNNPHQNNNSNEDRHHDVGNSPYSNVASSNDGNSNQPCTPHHYHHHYHQQQQHQQTHRTFTHNHLLPSPPHKSMQQHHHHQCHDPHHYCRRQQHQYEYSSSDNDFHNDKTDDALHEPGQDHMHSSVSELTQQPPKDITTSMMNEATTTTTNAPTTAMIANEDRRLDSDVYDHVNDSDDFGLSNCCWCFKSCCEDPFRRQCAYRCFKALTRFTRLFLIIPNLIFLVFGSALIGVAVWIRSERESYFYVQILNRIPVGPLLTFDKLPILIIAVGSCILILSFLACCGACTESICFLYLYTTFLIIIMAAEVTLGIMAFVMREQIQLKLETAMQNQIKYDYNSTDTYLLETPSMTDQLEIQELQHLAYIQHITMAWDRLQMQFGCCGAIDPGDYIHSLWHNRSSHAPTIVPPSCCFHLDDADDPTHTNWITKFQNCQSEITAHKTSGTTGFITNHSSILKTQGCKEALMNILQKNITFVIVGVIVVVILQMLDFILACLLMKYLRRKMENSSWYEDDDFE